MRCRCAWADSSRRAALGVNPCDRSVRSRGLGDWPRFAFVSVVGDSRAVCFVSRRGELARLFAELSLPVLCMGHGRGGKQSNLTAK